MSAPIKSPILVPCVALSLLIAGGETFAQSIVPASDGTGTIVNIDGNEFIIEGGTLSGDGANLFHSFLELGLDANQIATFLSHPQIQNILGRVTGGNPSVIDGLVRVLGGNSNLYLMNPSGFVFGSNAILNVPGDFFATTAQGIGFGDGLWFDAWGENDYQSLTGTPIAFDLSDRSGVIINGGDLAVSEGQNIGLIGGSVINTGSLSAPEGNVSIVAMPESGRLRISQAGNVLGFEIEPPRDRQGNPVAVREVDIPELITGSGVETGVTIAGNEISVQGTNVPVSEGSAILLGRRSANASGELAATGGNVDVLGGIVALIGAEIDVSGTEGGGNVRIGGEKQGSGTMPRSDRVWVDANSTIRADGEKRGTGGHVIIWADGVTRFAGEISATGGQQTGDGGFVEVSGLQVLHFQGTVDTSAPQGQIGILLLDPTNIEIVASGQETGDLTQVDEFWDGNIGGDGDTKLAATAINNATSNVILQASNTIIFNEAVEIAEFGVGLTAQAKHHIRVNANITTNGGDVQLQANIDETNGGSLTVNDAIIQTGGGDFLGRGRGAGTGQNGVTVADSAIYTGAGNIEITGIGGILGRGIQITNSTLVVEDNGNLVLEGTGNSASGIQIAGNQIASADGDIKMMGNDPLGDIFLNSANSDLQIIESTGAGQITIQAGISGSPTMFRVNDTSITATGDFLNLRSSQFEVNGGDLNIFGVYVYLNSLDSSLSHGNGGNINVTGILDLNINGNINSSGGLNGGNITLSNPLGTLSTPSINSSGGQNGGNVALQGHAIDTTAGLINAAGGIHGGTVTLVADENIDTGTISAFNPGFNGNGGDVEITSKLGDIDTTSGLLITGSAFGRGGNITLTADNGNIGVANVSAVSIVDKGGQIALSAKTSIATRGEITTNDNNLIFDGPVNIVDSSTFQVQGDGNLILEDSLDGHSDFTLDIGGSVTLKGTAGAIEPLDRVMIQSGGNLETRDIHATGAIHLTSDRGKISTGAIDTSATSGSAGNVILQSNEDISVASINAQSENDTGGNVTIATAQFFQATDTFSDRNERNASISVAGEIEGGTIEIYHGGNGQIPFIVGDSTVNGTAGAITRGNDTPERSIETDRAYPYTYKQDRDRLQIVSVPQPHISAQPQPAPPPLPLSSPDPVAPPPEDLGELDRGDNPLESLASLIGNLLNAETTIRTDETGDYAFEWQTTNPNTGEQVLLSLDVDNPYNSEETGSPIAEIARPSLNSLTALNLNANPEQIVTDIEQLLETEYETYFGDNLTDKEVTAESIRETLKTIEIETGTRAVIVYALPFPDALQLVLVRPEGQPSVISVPDADRRSLSRRLHQFRSALLKPTTNTYRVPARVLYQWLIAPIASELERLEIDTLIFSMGAGLRSLPLAALHDGEQFLVEKYSLGTIPSVALTDTRYQSVRDARILGMGAEKFDSFSNQPDLPSVPIELAAIVDRPSRGETFLNEEFTLKNLRHQRNESRYDIVHLATHASFQPENDRNTYIQFWQEKIRLDALREARWYDNATVELLVLSACETALGDRHSEMGFAGLAVRSGVKSALASLWKINDFVTLPAIAEFYSQLAREDIAIKAEALRQSQIALLSGRVRVESGQIVGLSQPISLPPELHYWEGRDLSHPYFWAGYTAIGSPW